MSTSPSAPSYPHPAVAVLPPPDDVLTDGVLSRRVCAWILDAVLLGIIAMMLWLAVTFFTLLTLGFGAPLFALLTFLPIAYGWVALASSLQATPGQAMMGLIVVRDVDFGPPTALQALISVLGYAATMALGVIWCAVALVTTRHRTLHDIASGLLVARRQTLKATLTSAGLGWNMAPGDIRRGGRPYA